MLNAVNVERVNYDRSIESLVVNSLGGGDRITLDDNAAATTINAGEGNDIVQVGQLFNARRDSESVGIAAEDFFATIETTRSYLSNGQAVRLFTKGWMTSFFKCRLCLRLKYSMLTIGTRSNSAWWTLQFNRRTGLPFWMFLLK